MLDEEEYRVVEPFHGVTLREKVVDAAMKRYRVSLATNDPAKNAFLNDANFDLHEACRKLDEHDKQVRRG